MARAATSKGPSWPASETGEVSCRRRSTAGSGLPPRRPRGAVRSKKLRWPNATPVRKRTARRDTVTVHQSSSSTRVIHLLNQALARAARRSGSRAARVTVPARGGRRIVGDHDDDPRQSSRRAPGHQSRRGPAGQRAGRALMGSVRSSAHQAERWRGVPDPRDGRRGRATAKRVAVIRDAGSTERPRRREALPGARGEEAPPRPAVGPMKPRVRVPESTLDMMGRLPRKRLRSDAGTTCHTKQQAEEDRRRAHARSVPGRAQTDQTRGSTRGSSGIRARC